MMINGSLRRHKGHRPCRAMQVRNRMLNEHGLVVIPSLTWAKVFKWADLPYERLPAIAGNGYRRPKAWGHKSQLLVPGIPEGVDLDAPLYEGLDDALFVERWVPILIKGRSPRAYREALKPLVDLLRGVHARDTEFKLAMMTTHILGGDAALNMLLVTEGLWSPQLRGS